MPLAVGTRLGAYDIVAPLGAGGMGEVYRAHDARLEWSPATKELLFIRDADLVALRYTERDGGFIVERESVLAKIGVTDLFRGVTPDGQRFLIVTS
jgi:hypothetical protein